VVILGLALIFLQAPAQDDKAAQKAAEKAASEAVDAFNKVFKGAEAEKVAAIEALGKVQHLKTANRLAGVLSANESGVVRSAAVKALGKFSDQKKTAATVLSSALGASTKEPGIFGAICSAIAELQEPSAASALAKYFDDKDENVARMTIEAAGKSGCSVNIDALIGVAAHSERLIRNAANASGSIVTDPATGKQYVSGPEVRARDRAKVLLQAVNDALRSITKETITTSDGWSAWWSKNKATFDRK
jgi:HEAT repeat protein